MPSLAQHARPPAPMPDRPDPPKICVVCRDDACVLVELDCPEHDICLECLLAIFTCASKSENAYPPRCCRASDASILDPYTHGHLLPNELLRTYLLKVEEYETHPTLRVYCAKPECSTFLNLDKLNLVKGLAHCKTCSTFTCPDCKQLADPMFRHRCAEETLDVNMQRLLASDVMIKRCPSCRAVVEWVDACNHMTCFCQHQFCFGCLERWPCRNECPTYSHRPVNAYGFDDGGYHKDTGLHRDTRRTRRGFDAAGLDREGFREDGYNLEGYNRSGIDRQGYNRAGFNVNGFDRDGFNAEGYDEDGYNVHHRDRHGRLYSPPTWYWAHDLHGHVEDGLWVDDAIEDVVDDDTQSDGSENESEIAADNDSENGLGLEWAGNVFLMTIRV